MVKLDTRGQREKVHTYPHKRSSSNNMMQKSGKTSNRSDVQCNCRTQSIQCAIRASHDCRLHKNAAWIAGCTAWQVEENRGLHPTRPREPGKARLEDPVQNWLSPLQDWPHAIKSWKSFLSRAIHQESSRLFADVLCAARQNTTTC